MFDKGIDITQSWLEGRKPVQRLFLDVQKYINKVLLLLHVLFWIVRTFGTSDLVCSPELEAPWGRVDMGSLLIAVRDLGEGKKLIVRKVGNWDREVLVSTYLVQLP